MRMFYLYIYIDSIKKKTFHQARKQEQEDTPERKNLKVTEEKKR